MNNLKKKIDGRQNNGGKRTGSGNKLKYGEPTTTKAYRLPISKVPEVTAFIKKKLEEWKIGQNA